MRASGRQVFSGAQRIIWPKNGYAALDVQGRSRFGMPNVHLRGPPRAWQQLNDAAGTTPVAMGDTSERPA
jgi:hypothetical protein